MENVSHLSTASFFVVRELRPCLPPVKQQQVMGSLYGIVSPGETPHIHLSVHRYHARSGVAEGILCYQIWGGSQLALCVFLETKTCLRTRPSPILRDARCVLVPHPDVEIAIGSHDQARPDQVGSQIWPLGGSCPLRRFSRRCPMWKGAGSRREAS